MESVAKCPSDLDTCGGKAWVGLRLQLGESKLSPSCAKKFNARDRRRSRKAFERKISSVFTKETCQDNSDTTEIVETDIDLKDDDAAAEVENCEPLSVNGICNLMIRKIWILLLLKK